jgi:protein involved in polysaccharide export with SLBB domain
VIERRRVGVLLALALLTLAAPEVTAQNTDPDEIPGLQPDPRAQAERARQQLELRRTTPDVVQAGPVDPDTYVLGPGDLLEIDLWGRLARAVPLEVGPEGRVFLPGRGPLNVSGQTLAWAKDRILKMIAEQYVGVRADVRLVRLRTFKVYMTGLVRTTGPFEVNSAMRASEAIAHVGLADGASRRNIEVRRVNGVSARLDLDRFERLGRQDADPLLGDGDVIQVPRAIEFVDMAGAVARPGRFELAKGDSLSTLLALTGGVLPSAVADRALMVRFRSPSERESVWVNLGGAMADHADFPLRDGDRVFIQYRAEYHELPTVGVVGEIERPGTYPIVLGRDRLSTLIAAAGGFRPQANRASVYLIRETVGVGVGGDPEFDRLARLSRNEMTESEYTKLETMLAQRKNNFRVDWNRLQAGNTDLDPLLQNGDLIRVERLVPSVRVEGQVKRPGYVDYEPGRTLGEYIQLAGGFTERSSRNTVRVSRALTGQVIPARSLKNVQPGDFIWVPERRDVDTWAAFRDIVTVAGQVAVIIFTLSR